MKSREKIIKTLKTLGPMRVRERLNTIGGFDLKEAPIAKAWLAEKEKHDKDEKFSEEIKVAKEANRIAQNAKNISLLALIISLLSMVIILFK